MTSNENSISGITDDCYTKPVGVSDQSKIPDDHMTASSQYGDGYQAAYGRLDGNRGDGWCAKEAGRNDDWLQVDLGTEILVCAVATQGDRDGNEWVTDFKLSYSSDGNVWTPYKDVAGVEVVRSACLSHDDDDHYITNIIFSIATAFFITKITSYIATTINTSYITKIARITLLLSLHFCTLH